jgi:hypothetical protein
MINNSVRSQVKRGFRRAGAWLLGFAWLGLVVAGLAIAFTPSPHSPALGWVLLTIAALVLVLTMDRCVDVFSALLTTGIIGGILTIVDGHAVNHPEVPIGRFDATIMTLLIAASAVVSFTFTKHKLTVPDRIAVFVFVFCFFWQAVVPHLMLVALGIGFASLFAAWVYDRTRLRNRHSASGNAS